MRETSSSRETSFSRSTARLPRTPSVERLATDLAQHLPGFLPIQQRAEHHILQHFHEDPAEAEHRSARIEDFAAPMMTYTLSRHWVTSTPAISAAGTSWPCRRAAPRIPPDGLGPCEPEPDAPHVDWCTMSLRRSGGHRRPVREAGATSPRQARAEGEGRHLHAATREQLQASTQQTAAALRLRAVNEPPCGLAGRQGRLSRTGDATGARNPMEPFRLAGKGSNLDRAHDDDVSARRRPACGKFGIVALDDHRLSTSGWETSSRAAVSLSIMDAP
jgi:hypothetical protein